MVEEKKGIVGVYKIGDSIPKEATIINVTSRSKEKWSQAFSPFSLGPLPIYPFDDSEQIISKNMENAWQYLKVYPEYSDNTKYREWSEEGWKNKKAVRFPMGRGAIPLYSLWKGNKLGYIEARFRIYAPLYAYCVRKHASVAYGKLSKLYAEGNYIALLDFDGYDYIYNGVGLEDIMYNEEEKMGHAFVLAMMLMGECVWEKEFDEAKIHRKAMKTTVY